VGNGERREEGGRYAALMTHAKWLEVEYAYASFVDYFR
jgi:hypothetical protein